MGLSRLWPCNSTSRGRSGWIRGFHAALYHEYLSDLSEGTGFATYPPMPEGAISGGHVAYAPVAPAFPLFVAALRKNRAACAGRLDKEKAGDKIDGIAALAMAVSRAIVYVAQPVARITVLG